MLAPVPNPPRVPFTEHRLDNGLRLVVSEDPIAPVVAVNVWYGVGSRHEVPGRTGFAHLFEHLMFQGSAHVKRTEHMQRIYSAGGSLNGTTWVDRTNYFETLPSHHLELALWLEADRMGGLLEALDQDNLDNQRDVVKNERRQRIDNQPYGTWYERMHGLAYPEGHPYHHSTIGSMEDLDAASLEDARGFYATWYAPDNAVLSVVGDVDTAEVRRLTEKYFAGIPAKGGFPTPPDTSVDLRIGAEVRSTVVEPVPVPRVFVGYRCPPFGTPGFDAVQVLATVAGGGRGSRLFKALVLDRQLLQPTGGSIVDPWPFSQGAAILIADLPAREGVTSDTVEAAYHDVMASIVADGITAEELERAHAFIASDWLHHLATVDGRADSLSQYATLFGDPGLVEEQLPRWLAVTADEVVAAAADVVREDNRAVLVFEPEVSAEQEVAA
jgi:predicted Zn-dependent peptidase